MDESIAQLNSNKVSFHPISKRKDFTSSTQLTQVDEIPIPPNSYYAITSFIAYAGGVPCEIRIHCGSSIAAENIRGGAEANAYLTATACGYTKSETTLNSYARYDREAANFIITYGFYITAEG